MKYLFVVPGPPAPIGGFKLLYEHGRILSNAGHDVRFLHVNGGLLSQISNSGLAYRLVRRLKFLWLNTFGKWRNYANQEFGLNTGWQQKIYWHDINNAEIIVIASWQLLIEFYESFDLSQVKVVHPVMDYPGFMGPADKIKSSWEKSATYFCISDYLYRSVLSHSNPEKLTNIGCLLPGEDIGYGCSDKELLEVSRQGILLSFSTGMYKNPEGTCELISRIRLNFPNERITVFGRPERPKELPSSVTYMKNKSDREVAKLYRSSKVFVFFSNFEGFGLMPLEAMRLGCAVVCTDCFGNRDYIEDKVNALIVSPGDVKKTISDIAILLKNDDLRLRLAKGGLKKSKEFLPSKFKEMLIEVYENV
jgi:glycosyltransferase involved in cell wall biosynthesis